MDDPQLLHGPLIFIESRMIFGLIGPHSPAISETIVWGCTASSIFVADLVWQAQELLRSRPVSVKARLTNAKSDRKTTCESRMKQKFDMS